MYSNSDPATHNKIVARSGRHTESKLTLVVQHVLSVAISCE